MATKLFDMLNTPLAMSKFASASDLTEQALQERHLAAEAVQCIDAQILCLEAELDHLERTLEDAAQLDTLRGIVHDLRAATTVDAHAPERSG